MSRKRKLTIALAVAATSGAALAALPAVAGASTASGVDQIRMVSDIPGEAPLTDPDLINPWGLAFTSTSKIWVSDAGTDVSTLYGSAPGSTTATKSSTVRVTLPGSPAVPTGQVAYTGKGFTESNGTTSGSAQFIFSTATGRIEAWNQDVDPSTGDAQIKATVPGAAYTGLAEATSSTGDELYAANFAGHKIDVFDSQWQQVKTTRSQFNDPNLPEGYSPFNVQAINGKIFVSYDALDPSTGFELHAPGAGAVDEYTVDGKLVKRIATHGSLNAPWGLAVAPSTWGTYAGDLLIGNFGDGHVNFVNGEDHQFKSSIAGQVLDNKTGEALVIPNLWALKPGTPTMGGTDSVWFSAAPGNGAHGLLGVLRKG
jgi:uncharacterized protein (TIGR03118 family)